MQYGVTGCGISQHKNIDLLNSFLTQANLAYNSNSLGGFTDEKLKSIGTGVKI
jgi:hypothetical protein